MIVLIGTLLFFVTPSLAQQQDALPVLLSPKTLRGENLGTCPSAAALNQAKEQNNVEIGLSLEEKVIPQLSCPCGGAGSWRRIAHLDMSDPNQQCPTNWRLISTPVRACGGVGESCVSAESPLNGMSYSRVCGKVHGYQFGSTVPSHPPGIDGYEGSLSLETS